MWGFLPCPHTNCWCAGVLAVGVFILHYALRKTWEIAMSKQPKCGTEIDRIGFDADVEVERILALSDDEVLREFEEEMRKEGKDPKEVIERMRKKAEETFLIHERPKGRA